MTPVSKPDSMVLSTTSLQWMGRAQLSISLGALFRLNLRSGRLLNGDELLPLWSRLLSALVPLDNGYPRAASRLLIYDTAQDDILRPAFTMRPGTQLIVDAHHSMTGCERIDMEMWRDKPVAQRLSWATGQRAAHATPSSGRSAWLPAQLPSLRARCFVEVTTPAGIHTRKLDTQLETVALFPEIGLGAVVYRAITPHPDKVTGIVGAWEAHLAPKRSLDVYCSSHVARRGEQAVDAKTGDSALNQCASSQLAPLPTSASSGTRSCATPHISSGSC